jgi:molybdopterin biosynthesis enzyme
MARGNQPSRPIALVDGLAVLQRDVQRRDASGPAPDAAPQPDEQPDDLPPLPPSPGEAQREFMTDAQAAQIDGETAVVPQRAPRDDKTGHHVMRLADDVDEAAEDWSEDEATVASEETAGDSTAAAAPDAVTLALRQRPQSGRREDSLQPGQAIAVAVGSEVPRGADLVLPLDELAGPPEPYDFDYAGTTPTAEPQKGRGRRPERPRREPRGGRGERDNAPEAEEPAEEAPAPVALPEPERNWDLPARFARGEMALPVSRTRLPRRLVPIGAWARNREVLLPERVMLRATELALLEACNIHEVEIYRRPVIGVANLGGPFPVAGQAPDPRRPGPDPLGALVQYLSRAAQVAALPFGFAPQRFRALRSAVERWAQQVDILLLVGGSHHGARCLGHDVLASFGQVVVSGIDLEPAGGLSAGYAGRTPCFVIPGTLPDVLAGFVLFARPLAHKYFMPQHFLGELPITLDSGGSLRFARNTAVPLRYSWDRKTGGFHSRYNGQQGEPWLENMRGHALAVFEAGRQYADGQVVTGWVY